MGQEHERLADALEDFIRQFAEHNGGHNLQNVTYEYEDEVIQHGVRGDAHDNRVRPARKQKLKIFKPDKGAAEQPAQEIIVGKRVVHAYHGQV